MNLKKDVDVARMTEPLKTSEGTFPDCTTKSLPGLSGLPGVSIVIPAYNAAATLGKTLEGCLQQTYPGAIEILVVDDGSTDPTGTVVVQYASAVYLCQANSGPAQARNTGWKAANGEIIFFTDSDCVPNPNWVTQMVRGYTDAAIGAVGGSYDMLNPHSLLAYLIHEEIVQRHLHMPVEVPFLGSYNVSFRRAALESVGGFDESYRMASAEDNDLCYRLRNAGWRLLFDRTNRVGHFHPTRLWGYYRRQMWHGYWRMKLYRSHPKMAGGDQYSSPLDFLQPPLALLCALSLPLAALRIVPWLFAWLFAAAFLGLLMLQIPLTLAVLRRTGNFRCLALLPLLIGRSLARGIGMVMGILRFFVLDFFTRTQEK